MELWIILDHIFKKKKKKLLLWKTSSRIGKHDKRLRIWQK
jgi:hypothetical protein